MKKLIIAVAIVGFATVTNAAAFLWSSQVQAYGPSVANLTPDASGNYAVGTANADRMRAEGTSQGVTWTYVMILTSGSDSETIEGTLASTSYSSNKFNVQFNTTSIDIPSGETPATISWEIVLTGTKTTEAGTYTYVSDTITGNASYTSLSSREISTGVATTWAVTVPSAPVIPEPTTGLLVLLGLAGLSLRRKYA